MQFFAERRRAMTERESFIRGTAILVGANAVSKILGAIFKIPLTYILREEGMAVFNTAMTVYASALGFIISGVPLASAKLTAGALAVKNYGEVKKITRVSAVTLCAAGFLGSLILFFGADFFAAALKDPNSAFAVRVLSPSVFFVAWGCVYKSFYQGAANMLPVALSQVLEAVVKLLAGFAGAWLLAGAAVGHRAGGAAFGITVSEIIAALVLMFIYALEKHRMPDGGEAQLRPIVKKTAAIAIPCIAASSVSGALALAEVAVIRSRLLHIVFTPQTAEDFLLKYSSYTAVFDGLRENLSLGIGGARWLYGAYSGYALTVFHLPTGIIASVGVSLLPIVAGNLAVNNTVRAGRAVSAALRLTLLITLPSAMAMYLFAEPLLRLLFGNTASAGLLKMLAPCLVCVGAAQLFTSVLHASGRITEALLNNLAGTAVRLAGCFFLVAEPHLNISGAVIASGVGSLITMLLNAFTVRRQLRIRLNLKDAVLKPAGAAAVMGLVMYLLYEPMCIVFGNAYAALAISVFVGGVAYMLILTSLGFFKDSGFLREEAPRH